MFIINMIKKIIEKIKSEVVNSTWFVFVRLVANIVFTTEYTYLLWREYGETSSFGFYLLIGPWVLYSIYALIILAVDVLKIVRMFKKEKKS